MLKCEHQQKTGSFKVRGALAKLLSLSAGQRERGVVAASSENHGLGVAYAVSVLGGTGIICVPEHALGQGRRDPSLRRGGALLGREAAETEQLARLVAAER